MPNTYFDVAGAGEISISKDCNNSTGNQVGFVFGVSWGRHGFTGGVLSRSTARELAEHILLTLENEPSTEREVLDKMKDILNF